MARVPAAFSCDRDFLNEVDRRAKSLNMTRSAYIVHALRQELRVGGDFKIKAVAESGNAYAAQSQKFTSKKKKST